MSLDTSHSSSTPRFPLLALGNYGSWVGNAKAWFMRQGLWDIVSGRSKRPVPADSKAPTAAETEGIEAWDDKAEKAAGELYLLVSEEQKVHFAGITDDPCKMWSQLERVHLQRRLGARFNAYDALFSIRKLPDESLQALMARVDKAMQELHDAEFTLDKTDNELVCMTLLRALPDEYSSFASSLQMLDKLEKAKIQEAFVAEELLRNRSNNSRDVPSGALSASALATSTPTTVTCEFCSLPGHSQSTCHHYRTAKVTAAQDATDRAQERRKTAPEVAKALPTPLLSRIPLLLLLQCRNSLVKQVFVPTRPIPLFSALLTHSGLQTQVPLLI